MALVVGVALLGLVGHAAAGDDPNIEAAPLSPSFALLAVAVAVPLWWRRSRPFTLVAVTVSCSIVGGLIDEPGLFSVQVGVVAIVLCHALGAWSTRPRWATALVVAMVLLVFAGSLDSDANPLAAAAFGTALLAFPFALGLASRQRRSYLAEVESRLAAAERDRDEQARRAIADERTRIARELHDVVAHHVSLIGVQASAARTTLDSDQDTTHDALAAIEASSRDAVGEMHRLLDVLRPVEGSAASSHAEVEAPEAGLDRLPHLADTWRAAGYEIALDTRIDRPLPSLVSSACFRIVEESLTNVARHSTATTAAVEVAVAPDGSELTVRIDDPGPARPRSDDAPSGGRGLVGIRERVMLFGGSLSTGTTSTGGFRVDARMPVPT